MKISYFKTLLFDCDGVILNSNKIKTDGFFDFGIKFGLKEAKSLVNYHVSNGGVSRYEKIKYFYKKILNKDISDEDLDSETKRFSNIILEKLYNAEMTKGLNELKKITNESLWFVVSGSDQNELRNIFDKKNISEFFENGIFGSPNNKETIIKSLLNQNLLKSPIVYIGDSKYDFNVSKKFGFEFIYLQKWSEWNIENEKNSFFIFDDIESLIQNEKS